MQHVLVPTWDGVTEDAEAEHRRCDTPRPALHSASSVGPRRRIIAPVYSGVPPCRQSRGAEAWDGRALDRYRSLSDVFPPPLLSTASSFCIAAAT